jgi:hypothetical protein
MIASNHLPEHQGVLMSPRTFTLLAAPLGSMLPGRPVDWDQLPADARAWAQKQADNDNEMLTVLDGDHRADFQNVYDLYVVDMS